MALVVASALLSAQAPAVIRVKELERERSTNSQNVAFKSAEELKQLREQNTALRTELEALKKQLPGWEVVNGHHLHRRFDFPDFVQALAFVNKVGELAEQQGHHPDILLTWGKAEVTTWTHKIDGLTESDFVLAAKIDKITR